MECKQCDRPQPSSSNQYLFFIAYYYQANTRMRIEFLGEFGWHLLKSSRQYIVNK